MEDKALSCVSRAGTERGQWGCKLDLRFGGQFVMGGGGQETVGSAGLLGVTMSLPAVVEGIGVSLRNLSTLRLHQNAEPAPDTSVSVE